MSGVNTSPLRANTYSGGMGNVARLSPRLPKHPNHGVYKTRICTVVVMRRGRRWLVQRTKLTSPSKYRFELHQRPTRHPTRVEKG